MNENVKKVVARIPGRFGKVSEVGQRKTALPSLPLCPMRPFIMMAVK